ncbi:hypothetical protein AMATHDRAFT_139549 [Amanita thiersii Skay4041]|uniref:AB hydrolase-1 domain-containing protein n=1 Tax=Amanita thiersii Skay4041 TaxID=703135 RepID=A0A2A9NPU7_9AGAR|nr:hypothetical protein AMATHDRAFT_139549 [Amanita thiersii Skay4041]
MPFVDICCGDDYASIYYNTNTMCGNVSGFDPAKPSIILLHPFLLDSSWLDYQFDDIRLYQNYNMIAFDMRTGGRSQCKGSGVHDSWVDAADLAFCHQILHLPPCHILAFESLSVNCALRFAALFPEMCLSLTLCNIPSPTESKCIKTAYHDMMDKWCFAEDLEAFEDAAVEAIKILLGVCFHSECCNDTLDQLICYWAIKLPPSQRHRMVETVNVLLNRTPLNEATLRSITHPVLIIHVWNF